MLTLGEADDSLLVNYIVGRCMQSMPRISWFVEDLLSAACFDDVGRALFPIALALGGMNAPSRLEQHLIEWYSWPPPTCRCQPALRLAFSTCQLSSLC